MSKAGRADACRSVRFLEPTDTWGHQSGLLEAREQRTNLCILMNELASPASHFAGSDGFQNSYEAVFVGGDRSKDVAVVKIGAEQVIGHSHQHDLTGPLIFDLAAAWHTVSTTCTIITISAPRSQQCL